MTGLTRSIYILVWSVCVPFCVPLQIHFVADCERNAVRLQCKIVSAESWRVLTDLGKWHEESENIGKHRKELVL